MTHMIDIDDNCLALLSWLKEEHATDDTWYRGITVFCKVNHRIGQLTKNNLRVSLEDRYDWT